MSNIGITLTIIGIISMIGAYLLYKNTPKTIIKELYAKNIDAINESLSQNENTPINILMQLQIDSRYHSLVSDNETYKEFSRNALGIIQDNNSQFKRSTYMDTI